MYWIMEHRYSDNSTQELEARVLAFCRQAGLFLHGQRAAAAVSGGADSMALLRLLLALAGPLGLAGVTACHVNHRLRGADADADEAFVRTECARLGVAVRVFRAGEEGLPSAAGGEAAARALRYACFARLRAEGIDRVATAHTVTDQAETLLFRLARGTGLQGAGGIRPARDFYVRPLLCLTRAEVESYCRALGQGWVTDATNLSDDYARNRLRHDALPALRQANAGAERNLARFCEKAARAGAYFDRMAAALLEAAAGEAAAAADCPAAVRRALDAGGPVYALGPLQKAAPLVLEAAAHALVAPHRDPEETYIRLVCETVARGSGAVQLRPAVRLRAGDGFFWEETVPPAPAAPLAGIPFCPEKQAEYPLGGGRWLRARLIKESFQEKTQVVHKKDLKNVADYARITMLHPALTLRSRLPGDTYRPAGRGVTKSLRKWMNEQAVPREERDRLPLLADGSEVVWVCGAGFAEGLAPDGAGGLALHLEIEARKGEERGR